MRIKELNDVVDFFVIAESSETFRGKDKELFFQNHIHLFSQYLSKIIYLECPKYTTDDPWIRQAFQRNYLCEGLKDAESDDIIMISDVDEIPRPSVVKKIDLELLKRKKFLVFDQKMYMFYLNLFSSSWRGTMITRYSFLREIGAENLRKHRHHAVRILNGGWHFTYLGGETNVLYKLNAISKNKFDSWVNTSFEQIIKTISPRSKKVIIDESFPIHILDNINYYQELGFILK